MYRFSSGMLSPTTLLLSAVAVFTLLASIGEAADPKPSAAREPVLEFKVEGPKAPVSLQAINSRSFTIPFKIRTNARSPQVGAFLARWSAVKCRCASLP